MQKWVRHSNTGMRPEQMMKQTTWSPEFEGVQGRRASSRLSGVRVLDTDSALWLLFINVSCMGQVFYTIYHRQQPWLYPLSGQGDRPCHKRIWTENSGCKGTHPWRVHTVSALPRGKLTSVVVVRESTAVHASTSLVMNPPKWCGCGSWKAGSSLALPM